MNKDINFFFCYSNKVATFLNSMNIRYITVAIEPITGRTFTLYLQTEELTQALKDYKKSRIHN